MTWISYAVVALIGALVGIGEIVSRNKERPALALRTLPSAAYIAINVSASTTALLLVQQLEWTFGLEADDPALDTIRILVAGFGAMAVLRSSLFVINIGGENVGVGPGALLTGLADVADAAVQRQVRDAVIAARGKLARYAMEGVDLEHAILALPTYCLALSGDVDADRQESLGADVAGLQLNATLDDRQKLILLGLTCISAFGESTVSTALEQFGETMFRKPTAGPSSS